MSVQPTPVFVQSLSLPLSAGSPAPLGTTPPPTCLPSTFLSLPWHEGVAGLVVREPLAKHAQHLRHWLQLCAEGARSRRKLEGSGQHCWPVGGVASVCYPLGAWPARQMVIARAVVVGKEPIWHTHHTWAPSQHPHRCGYTSPGSVGCWVSGPSAGQYRKSQHKQACLMSSWAALFTEGEEFSPPPQLQLLSTGWRGVLGTSWFTCKLVPLASPKHGLSTLSTQSPYLSRVLQVCFAPVGTESVAPAQVHTHTHTHKHVLS